MRSPVTRTTTAATRMKSCNARRWPAAAGMGRWKRNSTGTGDRVPCNVRRTHDGRHRQRTTGQTRAVDDAGSSEPPNAPSSPAKRPARSRTGRRWPAALSGATPRWAACAPSGRSASGRGSRVTSASGSQPTPPARRAAPRPTRTRRPADPPGYIPLVVRENAQPRPRWRAPAGHREVDAGAPAPTAGDHARRREVRQIAGRLGLTVLEQPACERLFLERERPVVRDLRHVIWSGCRRTHQLSCGVVRA